MTQIAASRVLWPDGTLAPGTVEVDGERIVAVGRPSGPVPERILAPGFVDLQVNGHDDVDVATAETADEWRRLDDLLVAQGVTTWCPTVTTAAAGDMASALERIDVASRRDGLRPTIAGAHMEGPFLGRHPGAHPREHIVPADPAAVKDLPDIVRVLTLAPEAEGALDAVAELARRGLLVSLGHSGSDLDQARGAVDAGARLVTHAFNGMAPLHHRAPGLLGVALGDDRVAISLIADLVHVHPAVLRIATRSKPRNGLVLVTDAVAWRSARHRRGGVRLVDGAPRRPDGTLVGSALTMIDAVRNLVGAGAADLAAALAAASASPARLLGMDDRGAVAVGQRADLVCLDTDLTVRSVWIGGRPVLD